MDRKKMESKKQIKNGDHVNFFFQMPLHYPRYSKKDYEHMPEWQIDRLLSDYGFSSAIDSLDLASKREFAMGAFLWPDLTHQQTATTTTHPSPSAASTASCSNKLVKVVEFLYRVLGIA